MPVYFVYIQGATFYETVHDMKWAIFAHLLSLHDLWVDFLMVQGGLCAGYTEDLQHEYLLSI